MDKRILKTSTDKVKPRPATKIRCTQCNKHQYKKNFVPSSTRCETCRNPKTGFVKHPRIGEEIFVGNFID